MQFCKSQGSRVVFGMYVLTKISCADVCFNHIETCSVSVLEGAAGSFYSSEGYIAAGILFFFKIFFKIDFGNDFFCNRTCGNFS